MSSGSCEPINIFSYRIDPRGVAQLLRTLGTILIKGPENDWTEIQVTLKKKGFFSKAPVLVFGHDSSYYDGTNWPKQIMGMQGYFARFPETPAKAQALRTIGTFRFALSLPQCDLEIESNDPRLDVLYAVCRHLDGVIFTPSALRDSKGQVIIAANGEYDPEAVFPKMPPGSELENQGTSNANDAGLEHSDESDDNEEPPPPNPDRVARRALALTAVAARATLELDREQVEQPDSHRQRILQWIDEIGIGDELEPDEWKVLQRPVGKLDERSFINSMWRVEGLAVLAWALQRYELPPDDELVTVGELYSAMALNDADAGRALLAEPRLRSSKELAEMHSHLKILHWRTRNYRMRPEAMDFREFSQTCWWGKFDISHFRLIDNDLAIGKLTISRASAEDCDRVLSLSMERHLAINWLLGYNRIYSETDTST